MGEVVARFAKTQVTKTVTRGGKTHEQRYWVRSEGSAQPDRSSIVGEGPTTSERWDLWREGRKLPTFKAAKKASKEVAIAYRSGDHMKVYAARMKYEKAKQAHWVAMEALEKKTWAKH